MFLRQRVAGAVLLTVLSLFAAPVAAAQPGAPPWSACGVSAPETKPAKTFPARPPAGGPTRSYAVLQCGNSAYGYRHIAARHRADWEAITFYTGGGWRDLADFAMQQALTAPQPGYPAYNAKNDTWTYKTPMQIRDADGNVRTTYWPIVSVAAGDGKIITSFPTRNPA